MSEFHAPVVEIGELTKHPDADTLEITKVFDYPCIVRIGDFKPGDKAVYIPVDAVVPNTAQFAFLGENRRIKARRLRGIFSMGLLVPAEPDMIVGEDVLERMGIVRYEPPEHHEAHKHGQDEKDPGFLPVYTNIEGMRRWPDVLKIGEEVAITEKVHGSNFRAVWREKRLWVGSHTRIKKEDANTKFWKAANDYKLAEKLEAYPNMAIYGEVYGEVGGFPYDKSKNAEGLALFDAMDTRTRRYLNYDDFVQFAWDLDLPTVPLLYRGGWNEKLRNLAEGDSVLGVGKHIKEGFVVRPVVERWDDRVGRVILKLISESFLLGKKK